MTPVTSSKHSDNLNADGDLVRDFRGERSILEIRGPSRPRQRPGDESARLHFSLEARNFNANPVFTSEPGLPYILPCWPLFVLQVPAAVVKEDVSVLGQRPLHHPDAAVEEALELGGVQDLLPLLLRQLPQHRERAWGRNQKHPE